MVNMPYFAVWLDNIDKVSMIKLYLVAFSLADLILEMVPCFWCQVPGLSTCDP